MIRESLRLWTAFPSLGRPRFIRTHARFCVQKHVTTEMCVPSGAPSSSDTYLSQTYSPGCKENKVLSLVHSDMKPSNVQTLRGGSRGRLVTSALQCRVHEPEPHRGPVLSGEASSSRARVNCGHFTWALTTVTKLALQSQMEKKCLKYISPKTGLRLTLRTLPLQFSRPLRHPERSVRFRWLLLETSSFKMPQDTWHLEPEQAGGSCQADLIPLHSQTVILPCTQLLTQQTLTHPGSTPIYP